MKGELILHWIFYRLFHIEESIERNVREIETQTKALAGLREDQRVHNKALEDARREQAQARSTVMQKEKKIKRAEKALDAKVFCSSTHVELD
jgi:structural maintenance of chromosome 1